MTSLAIPAALGTAGELAGTLANLPTARSGAPPPAGRSWPQSLAGGAAGIALLHVERARSGHGDWPLARRWLSAAVCGEVTAAANASLFFGAPALAFVLHIAAASSSQYHRALAAVQDSRCLLAHLQDHSGVRAGHRRELSLMLCSILMRAARQDWYEQGDVWARVTEHREFPAGQTPQASGMLHEAVARLISVDAESQMREGAPLARAAPWADAYAAAGRELAGLHAAGQLHRGMRDILAHHVIFAWNRLGLSYAAQAILAATATTAIFGPDPATGRYP